MLGRAVAAAMVLALLGPPVFAEPADTLCALAAEPAQIIAACTDAIGEKVLRDSARAKAYARRGHAYLAGNSLEAARADFEAALGLDADNVDALVGRATIDGHGGHAEQAQADFARVERLAPNSVSLHVNRAEFYIAQRRYAEALADAEFQRYGTGAGSIFLNLRCRAHAYGGIELDKGRQACDQALWVQANAPALIEARGIIALKQKRYEAALTDFTGLSVHQPQAARAWYGKGLAETALGHDAVGKADIAHAESLNSNIAAIYRDYSLPPG